MPKSDITVTAEQTEQMLEDVRVLSRRGRLWLLDHHRRTCMHGPIVACVNCQKDLILLDRIDGYVSLKKLETLRVLENSSEK